MGCGAYKLSVVAPEPYVPESPVTSQNASLPDPALNQQLAGVVRCAGAGKGTSSELDEVLRAFGSGPGPEAVAEWFEAWLPRASQKQRSGLVSLLQQLLVRELTSRANAAAEAVKASKVGDAAEGVDFSKFASLCEDALRVPEDSRAGLRGASAALGKASRWVPPTGRPSEALVPALDSIVLLFQRAFVGQRAASAAKNLTLLRDLEIETGLPPVQDHLGLVGASAKGLLLALMLVPQETLPVAVVVKRGGETLSEVAPQLPDGKACVLMPSFESSSGTKVVNGKLVEGGEGHGLRKEFFASISADALATWSSASTAFVSEATSSFVSFQGSRLKLQSNADEAVTHLLKNAANGAKIRLIQKSGDILERNVTSRLEEPGGKIALLVSSPLDEGLLATIEKFEVLRPVLALFEFHRGTGDKWFSAHANSLDDSLRGRNLRMRYTAFGKVLALAMANQCKLTFTLPPLFFHFLLNRLAKPSLEDVRGFDKTLHANLRKCLTMKDSQFKSIKDVEGLPDSMTREQYVDEQIKDLLTPQAMKAIQEGFWGVVAADAFDEVQPADVRFLVCPTSVATDRMTIRQIFRIVLDDDMNDCTPFVQAFYSVLDSLNSEEKKQFFLFSTGMENPPEPGVEQLTVQLPFSAFSKEEHKAMLGMLPQAHTCTNTFELPNYYEALKEVGGYSESALKTIIGERLRTAIRETEGYELDATGVRGEAVVPFAPPGISSPWAIATPVSQTPRLQIPGLNPGSRPTSGWTAPEKGLGPTSAWEPSIQKDPVKLASISNTLVLHSNRSTSGSDATSSSPSVEAASTATTPLGTDRRQMSVDELLDELEIATAR